LFGSGHTVQTLIVNKMRLPPKSPWTGVASLYYLTVNGLDYFDLNGIVGFQETNLI